MEMNKNPITDKDLIKIDKRFKKWSQTNIYPLEYLYGKRYIIVFEYNKQAHSIHESDSLKNLHKYLYDLGENTIVFSMTKIKDIFIFDRKTKKELK